MGNFQYNSNTPDLAFLINIGQSTFFLLFCVANLTSLIHILTPNSSRTSKLTIVYKNKKTKNKKKKSHGKNDTLWIYEVRKMYSL